LGLPAECGDAFLLVSLGAVQAHKRIEPLLQGLALARRTRPELRLVLVGEERARELDLREAIARLGLEDAVHCTGYVEESVAWDFLAAGDMAINLRGPTTGGASGGVFQAFSFGRAAIVSDAPQVAELPDDTVRRIPTDESEVQVLERELIALATDRDRVCAMETAVKRFVNDECDWSLVAARYLEAFEAFPMAKSAKKTLLRVLIEYGEKKVDEAETRTADSR